jgi:WD40 repeat protein
VACPSDGRWLTTASYDQTARIWDTRGNSELATLYGHNGWVQAVGWSPDGRRATASDDRTARIWNANSGSEISIAHGHDDWVLGLAWSSDGRRLVTASRDRTVRSWDADSGSQLAVLLGHGQWCGPSRGLWTVDGLPQRQMTRLFASGTLTAAVNSPY